MFLTGMDWYSNQLPELEPDDLCLDSSVSVLTKHIVSRIKQTLPKAKFIWLVCNPVERVISEYVEASGFEYMILDTDAGTGVAHEWRLWREEIFLDGGGVWPRHQPWWCVYVAFRTRISLWFQRRNPTNKTNAEEFNVLQERHARNIPLKPETQETPVYISRIGSVLSLLASPEWQTRVHARLSQTSAGPHILFWLVESEEQSISPLLSCMGFQIVIEATFVSIWIS